MNNSRMTQNALLRQLSSGTTEMGERVLTSSIRYSGRQGLSPRIAVKWVPAPIQDCGLASDRL